MKSPPPSQRLSTLALGACLMLAACGTDQGVTSSATPPAEDAQAIPELLPNAVSAKSATFQRAGDEIRAVQAKHPEYAGKIDPFITDPIDVAQAGEYRISITVPAGTDTHDLAIVAPGDAPSFFQLSNIGFEPAGVTKDGAATVVLQVGKVYAPYDEFQLWIQ